MSRDIEKEIRVFPKLNKNLWKEKIIKDLKGKKYDSLFWHVQNNIVLEPFYTIDDIKYLKKNTIKIKNKKDNDWIIVDEIKYNSPEQIDEAIEYGVQQLNVIINEKFNTNHFKNKDIIFSFKFQSLPEYSKLTTLINFLINENKNNILLDELQFNSDINLTLNLLKNLPSSFKGKTIFINGEEFQISGASLSFQIAVVLSEIYEYLILLLEKGISVETFVKRIYISFALSTDIFSEIAKIKAFEMLFAKILKEFTDADNLEKAFIETRSSLTYYTQNDEYNNIIRGTLQCLSGVLSSADAIFIHPFDILKNNPTSKRAKRWAINISHILKEEAFMNRTINPLNGSYSLQILTNKIAEKAWDEFKKIKKQGGFVKAMQNGYIKNEINKQAKELIEKFKNKKKILVGINKYCPDKSENIKIKDKFITFLNIEKELSHSN